jgi:hypothetical protein
MIDEAAVKHPQGGKCRGHLVDAGEGGMQKGKGASVHAASAEDISGCNEERRGAVQWC